MTRFLQTVPAFLRNCFVVWIAAVVALVVLAPPFLTYACKIPIDSWNPLFFLVAIGLGLLGIAGFYFFNKRRRESNVGKTDICVKDSKRNKTFKRVIFIGTIVLVLVQLFIIASARFMTGWDVWYIANLSDVSQMEYFSHYPNQLFLNGAFMGIANLLQVFGFSNYYLVLICLSSLSVAICVPMVAYIAKRIAGYAVGYIAFFLTLAMCGLSPWIMVPYSDTFGMLFTVFILWCYVCLDSCSDVSEKKALDIRKCCRWFFIGFATFVGYAIKPTVIFVFIAIVIVESIQLILSFRQDFLCSNQHGRRCEFANDRNNSNDGFAYNATGQVIARRPDMRQIIVTVFVCVLGIVLAFAFTSLVKSMSYDVDKNDAFSVTHFLMMGANPITGGVFSLSDVELSAAANSPEERIEANLSEFGNRIGSRDLAETNLFIVKKLLTNFADGTFAWEIEGDFYLQIIGKNQAVLDFYGISLEPTFDNNTFAPLAQVLWFFVLVGCVLIMLRRHPLKAETVIAFTLLMLSMFLMLFEARARYLFLYLPYFIILGTIGWSRLYARLQREQS